MNIILNHVILLSDYVEETECMLMRYWHFHINYSIICKRPTAEDILMFMDLWREKRNVFVTTL